MVQQKQACFALGRHNRDPAVPHVAAELAWQVTAEVHRVIMPIRRAGSRAQWVLSWSAVLVYL
jgi:hypothetical protein